MKKKKQPIIINASHQLYAFVEQIITRCALEKKTYKGVFTIPYNQILKKDIDMTDVNIKATITARWDGDLPGDEDYDY